MAADGYCNDLIELGSYVWTSAGEKTEIHILDYLSRYADSLLEDIVTVKNRDALIKNKVAYSYCKNRISRLLSNVHNEFEWAKILKLDDVNMMTEVIAKDGLLGDEHRIHLGEGCNSVGYLAGLVDESELIKTSTVMAYAMLYAPFYSALNGDYEFEQNPKQFNANSLSICTKRMVIDGMCEDERSKKEIMSGLPKILRAPHSIAFFERKIRKLEFYKICETRRQLEKLEQGYLRNRNIIIRNADKFQSTQTDRIDGC